MPRYPTLLLLLFLGLVPFREGWACSQCMCGTPFPADVLGGTVPTRFTYGLEDRYLSKSNALDEGPGSEDEREHRVAAFGQWRPLDRLALVGRLPYAVKEITTRPEGEPPSVATTRGLSDAELLAMIGITHGARSSLGLVAGATAPTGSNDLTDASGERLDAHLQSGTGAWTGTGGLNLSLAAAGGTFEASAIGRTSGENPHGYRYGNVLLFNAGFISRSSNGVRLLLQVNGRSAAKDRLEGGTMGENTGGTVVYASPGVRWISGFGLGLEAAVQIPVAQALYGDQTEHTTARLSLSMSP